MIKIYKYHVVMLIICILTIFMFTPNTVKAASVEKQLDFTGGLTFSGGNGGIGTSTAHHTYVSCLTDLSDLVAIKIDLSKDVPYAAAFLRWNCIIKNEAGVEVENKTFNNYNDWFSINVPRDLKEGTINIQINWAYTTKSVSPSSLPELGALNIRLSNPAIGEPHPSWQAQTMVERANNTWWTGAMTNGTFYSNAIDLTHVKNLSFQLQCGGGTSSAEPVITIVDDDDNILKTVTEGNTQTLRPNVYTPYKVNVSSLTGIGYVKLSGSNFKVQASEITSELMQYTLSYDANGGSNAPTSATVTAGNSTTISSTRPSRVNYDFLGWASSENSTVAEFIDGDTLTITGNTTLYAVWKSQSPYFSGFGNLTTVI